MAAATVMLQAQSPNELEAMINGYIAVGYSIANRTPTQVTLIKRKEFSVLWLVIGLILCLFPLFIYLIIYASETDKMVMINLARAEYAGSLAPAQASIPLSAPRSPDGNYWWDGQAWQIIYRYDNPPTWPY